MKSEKRDWSYNGEDGQDKESDLLAFIKKSLMHSININITLFNQSPDYMTFEEIEEEKRMHDRAVEFLDSY